MKKEFRKERDRCMRLPRENGSLRQGLQRYEKNKEREEWMKKKRRVRADREREERMRQGIRERVRKEEEERERVKQESKKKAEK